MRNADFDIQQQLAAATNLPAPGQPPVADVDARMAAMRVAITGQDTPPPATGWRMSNNRSATRLDALEPVVQQVLAALVSLTDKNSVLQGQLQLQQAAYQTLQANQTADEQRLAAVEAKATLIASATEANRLDLVALKAKVAADELATTALQARATATEAATAALQGRATLDEAAIATLQTRATADEAALATAQATATQARTEAAAAQAKADLDATNLLAVQAQATQAQATAATNAANLSAVAADVATRLPAAAVQRFSVNTPAVTVQVATPATVAVPLPKPFADAAYLVFFTKASGGLLSVEVSDTAKTASGFTLTLRNTGAVSLLVPASSVEVFAIHS